MAKVKKRPSKQKRGQEMQKNKAQTWSLDLIMGVIIFMLIIAIFYAFLTSRSESDIDSIEEDVRITTNKLSQQNTDISGLDLLDGNIINSTRMDELCDSYTYDEIKQLLGIESEVCIYLEDEHGRIIPCGSSDKAGIGNEEDVDLGNGVKCGQTT